MGTGSNVERLDMTIYDPHESLRSKRKSTGSSNGTSREVHVDEDSEDEAVTGIEAKLIMKLVCRHGKLTCPQRSV